jgi:opacity protein-like surface antigen
MNKKLALLSVILLGFSPAFLNAQSQNSDEPENYFAGHLGIHNLDDWDARVSLSDTVGFNGYLQIDSSWQGGILLGREYDNYRYEIELQELNFNVTSVSVNGVSESKSRRDGHLRAVTFNANRMFEIDNNFEAFAGLGIGWGETELPSKGFENGCTCFPEADESGLLWQARLGLDYEYNEHTEFFIQYTRILNMRGPSVKYTQPGVIYSEEDVSTISIGVRIR